MEHESVKEIKREGKGRAGRERRRREEKKEEKGREKRAFVYVIGFSWKFLIGFLVSLSAFVIRRVDKLKQWT